MDATQTMEILSKEIMGSLLRIGWHLHPSTIPRILQQIQETPPYGALQALVQDQLLNTDIRETGSPSLPDAPSLQRMHRLQGPLILQVVSLRSISESSGRIVATNNHGRLLRIGLTDGHTAITAIEYQPLPAFSIDTPPGTKVRLENAISVRSGILLLDAHSISVLGGHVQALHGAWEIERKCSVFGRTTLKVPRAEGVSGPPPFRGLSLGVKEVQEACEPTKAALQRQKTSVSSKADEHIIRSSGSPVARDKSTSSSSDRSEKLTKVSLISEGAVGFQDDHLKRSDRAQTRHTRAGFEPYRPRTGKSCVPDVENLEVGILPQSLLSPEATSVEQASSSKAIEKLSDVFESISSSQLPISESTSDTGTADNESTTGVHSNDKGLDGRLDAIKAAMALGLEVAPLQNRAAAQKLLSKRTDVAWYTGTSEGEHGQGRRNRRGGRPGRGGQGDERVMLTLDEWESRKGTTNASTNEAEEILDDAGLARKLQQQLDLESGQVRTGKELDEAEQIRLSMFNFAGDRIGHETGVERHRNRGKGRGRRRGR